ncbi:SDR family oxidoreductase [Thalassotalea ponticola]|uniref:SDR family oxidoreductase n=1 Tax=Thalassotalea ponticola TaxID=1523392 RepID=UPI0025B3BB2A|nr:SDR family oxidoreductase [Thalassotalea ponticola]MDN3651260.1 SDR family oxidoreductase [Thalassotalea ponticola]
MKKVVVITGGSRGIGAATSKLLAAKGFAVCVNYKSNKAQAESVVNDICDRGGKAFPFQADVSIESDVIALFEAVKNTYGSVTHLVNNAGILFQQASISKISVERFNKILTTNITSCFLCCREALKYMNEGAAIVNVSSAASRSGSPFEYIDYAASKGAIDTLTKGLSIEVASMGIRVNGVRPGFIYTDMHADGGEANRVDRLSPQIPLQRGGTPDEVANAILWLLSDEASYVTGSFIDLAGGK